ncbi:gamma-glutamylcyclotransferase [Phyllobacterium salinisoli]|uniref:glutathione-specific gamma-glutamylcyclotransferase n=1 Tax=Phyllobacterium salinisoli TaxID=1899321 RepID=A0A368JZ82_9HYPH|nr:gamma-glutamylcyclotransferase [Phyllobacterium salinisoli]RCS22437.1 gamma-glutamylcyclotransferase [Phyllobacterium salinisoli]
MGDFWVFGYGSLMWKPGFAHVETVRARLYGYRRALCIRSHIHRGTPEHPGLVLGLDRGGSCLGLAFRVPGDLAGEVLAYLRARELVTNVYLERRLPLRLGDGRFVEAVVYVADRDHQQYAGALPAERAAEIVASAYGQSGPNVDYVISTVEHLRKMGIRDHWLESVATMISAGDEFRA